MDFYSIPGIPEPQPDIGSWRTFSFLPQFSLDLVAFDCFLFRYSHLLLSCFHLLQLEISITKALTRLYYRYISNWLLMFPLTPLLAHTWPILHSSR
jgi:hypothetical protein